MTRAVPRPNPEVGVTETVSFVLERVGPGSRVLDVGCGAGEVAADR
ncbi:MAG: methionine biosynthesis protein MetW [Planctomycetota bacterium]